ncbi:FAD-dependent monooxygenase [Peribacillus butanolivorans]|uniref:FAD-dependent monooxygenase n=1 Tax=Peribacillus butanolivorans TaxID=421767 RepID=UPI0036DF15F6
MEVFKLPKKIRTVAILAQYFILSSFSKLETDITTDVLIVGSGITGFISAYLLAKQGVKVHSLRQVRSLMEQQATQPQKSRSSTAWFTTNLLQIMVRKRLDYEANTEGMLIKGLIEEHSIECTRCLVLRKY